MKKRLISILSIFACLCVVFTLGSAPVSHASANQYTAEVFSGYMQEWMQLWLAGDMDALNDNNEQYASYGMPVTYDVSEEEYKELVEKAGEFKEYSEPQLTTGDDGLITVTQSAVCSERNVDFTFMWNESTGEITWVTDVESTPLETFVKACLNTVMGMGTVFVVLIFISFVISLFVLFSRDKKKKETASEIPVNNVPAAEDKDINAETYASDDELIAVISAAVAAYEADEGADYEVPADGLFVRSIKKR